MKQIVIGIAVAVMVGSIVLAQTKIKRQLPVHQTRWRM
jgi:hypothetical protein